MAVQSQIIVLVLGSVTLQVACELVQAEGGGNELEVSVLAEPQCFNEGSCTCISTCRGSENWVHNSACNQTKDECWACNSLWCDFGGETGGGDGTPRTTTAIPSSKAYTLLQYGKMCTASVGASACTTPECRGSLDGCYEGLKTKMMKDCSGSQCCGGFFDWTPDLLCKCPTLNGGNPTCSSQPFWDGNYILEVKEEFLSESAAVTASSGSLVPVLLLLTAGAATRW